MTIRDGHFGSLEKIFQLPEFRGTRFETLQSQADGEWYRLGAKERFRVVPSSDAIPENIRQKLPLKLEIKRA